MKRLLRLLGTSVIALIIMLCLDVMSVKAAGAVPINSTTFPDPMFRAVISGPDYDREWNILPLCRDYGARITTYPI